MPKVIDATSMWKDYVEIIKKCRVLSPYIIKGPDNLLFMERTPPDIIESFAVIKDPNLKDFYVWSAIDINQVLKELKDRNIKTKGTHVSEGKDSITIWKDNEYQFSIDYIPNIQSKDGNQRFKLATSKYKLLPQHMAGLIDPSTEMDGLSETSSWEPVSEQTLLDLKSYGFGQEQKLNYKIMFPKRLYPLIKDTDAKVYTKELQYDEEHKRYIVGIREDYPTFTLYSVIAIMIWE